MGLISRVSSRTYRDIKQATKRTSLTSVKPAPSQSKTSSSRARKPSTLTAVKATMLLCKRTYQSISQELGPHRPTSTNLKNFKLKKCVNNLENRKHQKSQKKITRQ